MSRSRRPLRIAAMLGALVAVVLGAPGASAALAAVPADWGGVNAQWLFPSLPQAAWPAQADAMRDAGVRVVRLDAEWRRVEPVAPVAGVHDYRWDFYDAVVGTLAARGIRWYPVVDYSAPWSGSIAGQWRSPPASAAAYADYAAALARRYGPGGAFWAAHPELPALPVREWEIWNEENGSYFWPSAPDPAAYADLYLAARAALHAVDPGARAVVGGLLARGSGAFVSSMLSARPELRGQLDAVGLHSYGRTVDESLSTMVDLRNWLVALGLGDVPIEVTEVGWTTSGSPVAVSDAARAADLSSLLPEAAALGGVSRLLVHTWTSREQWPDVGEDWYGLFHADATPTASGVAFGQALRALQPPAPAGDGAVAPEPRAGSGAGAPAGSAVPVAAGHRDARARARARHHRRARVRRAHRRAHARRHR